LKHLTTARRDEEIVATATVFGDLQHGQTRLRIKDAAFGEKNCFVVVNGSSRRQGILWVPGRKTKKITDLFTLGIYDLELFTFE